MNLATVLPATFDLSISRLFGGRAAALRSPATPARGAAQSLPKGATLVLRRPLGCTVECERGSLWITFDGEPDDIVLDAGERHVAERRSRMLVHALDDSALRLVAAGGER